MTAIRIANYCKQFQTIMNNFNVIVDVWLITGDCNRLEFIPNKRAFRVTKNDYKWFWMTTMRLRCFLNDTYKMKMNFSKYGTMTAIRITNYSNNFE